jgi:hypothetical protein
VRLLIRFAPLSEFGGSLENVADHRCGNLGRLAVDGLVLTACGLNKCVEAASGSIEIDMSEGGRESTVQREFDTVLDESFVAALGEE